VTKQHEVVGVSRDIDFQMALKAYRLGVFPWPVEENLVLWYYPVKRAILFSKNFRMPNKTSTNYLRDFKQLEWKINENIFQRLNECRSYHLQKRGDTWLTHKLMNFYLEAWRLGYFFSLSAFYKKQLVGVIFSVKIGGYVCSETMYSVASHGSSVALYGLLKLLESQNLNWIDIQILNDYTFKLGGVELTRQNFSRLLRNAQAAQLQIPESFCVSESTFLTQG